MSKVPSPLFTVARREFVERVRSPWFLAITVLGPVLMVGALVLPSFLAGLQTRTTSRVAVVGSASTELKEQLLQSIRRSLPNLQFQAVEPPSPPEVLLEKIERKEILGYLDLPSDVLDDGTATYSGADAANLDAMINLERGLNTAVLAARANRLGFSAERLEALARRVKFSMVHATNGKPGGSALAVFAFAYLVMLSLYMAIILYAVNVMRSVIQEKTSRVVELIVSCVRPSELMAGKILGVGAVGLLQMSTWASIAAFPGRSSRVIHAWLGGSGMPAFRFPTLESATLLTILAYFLLGYFLYAALYAAVGAMCSSEQDAQQAQTPVLLLLVLPLFCIRIVSNDPRGMMSSVLTLIPFSSPVLMPMRYCLGAVGGGELALSLAILVMSVVAVTYLAGRIYRIGILSYGKRPSLRELMRWLVNG